MGVLPGIHRIPRIKGPNAYLLEGEGLALIDTGWPGHTPGSICFYLENSSTLFTGDLINQRGPYISRPVYTPGTDFEVLNESLRRVGSMRLDHACLSHGDQVLHEGSKAIRIVARRHSESPKWMQWLQNVPRLARLGIEASYRME